MTVLSTKDFLNQIYFSYQTYLKVRTIFALNEMSCARCFILKNLPECLFEQSIWVTVTKQLSLYAQIVFQYCQTIIPSSFLFTETILYGNFSESF